MRPFLPLRQASQVCPGGKPRPPGLVAMMPSWGRALLSAGVVAGERVGQACGAARPVRTAWSQCAWRPLAFHSALPFTGDSASDGSFCILTSSRETELWGSRGLQGNEMGPLWPPAPPLLRHHGHGASRGSSHKPWEP